MFDCLADGCQRQCQKKNAVKLTFNPTHMPIYQSKSAQKPLLTRLPIGKANVESASFFRDRFHTDVAIEAYHCVFGHIQANARTWVAIRGPVEHSENFFIVLG
jgi:hypothetical protein